MQLSAGLKGFNGVPGSGSAGGVDPFEWPAGRPAGPAGRGRAVLLHRTLTVLVVAALLASLAAPSALASGWGTEWTGTWATALTPARPDESDRSLLGFEAESIRMIVQTSIGGKRLRVRLSNVHGESALTIGHATVARPAVPSAPDLEADTVERLTFNGDRSVSIPAGADVLSDPIRMHVPPRSQLAITAYLPESTGPTTWHPFARQTAYIYDGNRAADPNGDGYTETPKSFYFLAGVEVGRQHHPAGSIAIVGASITDAVGSTADANRRWPDFLTRRLLYEPHFHGEPGVLNLGLAGNATIHDGAGIGAPDFGVRAVARVENVFALPNVDTVIVDQGLNDIFLHDERPERIIEGLRRITDKLQRRGIRVLLATLSPAAGADNWGPEREQTRQAVNAYIRTTDDADGVVDIAEAVRDPDEPTMLNPRYHSFDQVHPNDLGNHAIAQAVPLGLLR